MHVTLPRLYKGPDIEMLPGTSTIMASALHGYRNQVGPPAAACNSIYERIMSVVKNAASDFKADKAKAQQFSYLHVLKLQEQNKGDDNNNGSTATPSE